MGDSERQSLLKNEDTTMYTSPSTGAGEDANNVAVNQDDVEVTGQQQPAQQQSAEGDVAQSNVPFIGPDEVPPPYQQGTAGGVPMVTCRVCQNMIDITSKRDQHVVKCLHCTEATPIRNAPPGKKYVRCPCSCLLICKSSSQRIACPRSNCKRIINLAPSPVTPPVPTMPGMCRVTCGHCSDTFLFNTFNNSLARCPHCRKVSSVGSRFARGRGIIFSVIGFILFIFAIAITVGTQKYAQDHAGVYVVYIGIFLISLVLCARSLYYFLLKASHVDGPM